MLLYLSLYADCSSLKSLSQGSKKELMAAAPSATLVEARGMRFLITSRPADKTMDDYISVRRRAFERCLVLNQNHLSIFFEQTLKQHRATHVVRVCEPSYNTEPLLAAGIAVHVRAACIFLC